MKAQLATVQKQGLSLLMRRSLELFQLPFDELQKFVQDQVESNPFLSLPDSSNFYDKMDAPQTLSIRETLYTQVLGWREQEQAAYLIGLLDDDGYFREPCEEICKTLGLDSLEPLIQKMQTLEPVGVFARNLAECYKLQLKDLGEWAKEWEDFLDTLHLPSAHLISKFSKEHVQKMMRRLRQLSPYPAKDFQEHQTVVIPDLIATYENDEWVCSVTPYTHPQVQIETQYIPLATQYHPLKDQLKSAKWLVQTLSKRAEMLKAVTLHILNHQTDFFLRGSQGLKPLNLKYIADTLHVHESTISRVVRHKYVQTERGTFPLKFFFTQGVQAHLFSWDTEKISAQHIQDQIAHIIAKEPPQSPYSDQKLVDLLKDKGIPVARRTITKYRMLHHIPSASQRKNLYGLSE